jgi:hypothetical protein
MREGESGGRVSSHATDGGESCAMRRSFGGMREAERVRGWWRNPNSSIYISLVESWIGLWLGLRNINRSGPYKRSASEDEGIFGGGPLIRFVSVKGF